MTGRPDHNTSLFGSDCGPAFLLLFPRHPGFIAIFDSLSLPADTQSGEVKAHSRGCGIPVLCTPGREQLKDPTQVQAARILLADDNTIIQFITRRMLENLGCQVDVVATGQEALEALAGMAYDLVLMDCEMPRMDGLEATRQIRHSEGETRHTVVIAMTAHSFKSEIDACLAAGMDDYLGKPADSKALAALLRRWLPESRSAGAALVASVTTQSDADAAPVPDDFDPQALIARLEGDQALARELVDAFVAEMPGQIEALIGAIRAGETDTARRLAHKIRGAAVNICTGNLGAKAAEIERATQAGRLEELAESSSALLSMFNRALSQMKSGW